MSEPIQALGPTVKTVGYKLILAHVFNRGTYHQ